jgi:YfiH family protein
MSDTSFQPNEPFAWAQAPGGRALVCRPLERVARHLFTTRPWKLGSQRDEAAWGEVAEAMQVEPQGLVRLRQVHGASVAVCRSAPVSVPQADIVLTSHPELALVIQTADCVPLLIADTRRAAVAAAHAGWRGLSAGVPGVAIEALAREFSSRPADLVVAVGPSIGPCCYEVGEEVRARFEQAGFAAGVLARWFLRDPRPSTRNPSLRDLAAAPARTNRWYFDTQSAARDQLEYAGVPIDQIYVVELCTASHETTFCSYRRDGAGAGRMAAAIRCAPPRPSPRSRADRRGH